MFQFLYQFRQLFAGKSGFEFELKIAKDRLDLLDDLNGTAKKFQNQLKRLIYEAEQSGDISVLQERVQKAVAYFTTEIETRILDRLRDLLEDLKSVPRTGPLRKKIALLRDNAWEFTEAMKQVRYNGVELLSEPQISI
jgi:hypothetical protein